MRKMYSCPYETCGFISGRQVAIKSHIKLKHPSLGPKRYNLGVSIPPKVTIPSCSTNSKYGNNSDKNGNDTKDFASNCSVDEEMQATEHNPLIYRCCQKEFSTKSSYDEHLLEHLNANAENLEKGEIRNVENCFEKRVATYRIQNFKISDVNSFLEDTKSKTCDLIRSCLMEHKSNLKIQLGLFVSYRSMKNGKIVFNLTSCHTNFVIVSKYMHLERIYDQMARLLESKSEEVHFESLSEISHLEINSVCFKPLEGSSYIKLPETIAKRKACVNIRCEDGRCLAWCLVAALYPAKVNSSRPSSYRDNYESLQLDGVKFPVSFDDLPKIEKSNNLSINVYGLDVTTIGDIEVVGPLYYTDCKKDTHVNLLYLEEDEKSHFVLIKNLSRLVSKQINNHEKRIYLCDGCLVRFTLKKELERHVKQDCRRKSIKLPSAEKNDKPILENVLKFKNHSNNMKNPFVVYAHFQCLNDAKTMKHQPYSFSYQVICAFDSKLNRCETYTGADCIKEFIWRLTAEAKRFYTEHFEKEVPMTLTYQQQQDFDESNTCHICKSPIVGEKVRDHCHLTGEFRGAAHAGCNLHYKEKNFLPVFFCNSVDYGLKQFAKDFAVHDKEIDIIPSKQRKDFLAVMKAVTVNVKKQNNRKRQIVRIHLRFLDILNFLPRSLEELAQNFNPEHLIHTNAEFPVDSHFNQVKEIGVFPYAYVDSLGKLLSPWLPSKETFYKPHTEKTVSDGDFERALKIWKEFNCHTIGDYSNVYSKSHVTLSTDIFENFRKICLQAYDLDPAHYYNASDSTWDAMLKHTKVEMELLTDVDMLHFIQNGIRDHLSQCCLRHVASNNRYMMEHFDPRKSSSYLLHLRANNLYGWAMSQYLPYGGFHWLEETEIENFDILSISDTNQIGYVLEVDANYPDDLHDVHNDLPFLPEIMIVPPNSESGNRKLIANLHHKRKYIVHYRNLKQALQNGLQLVKVHRILAFNQSAWLKGYVDLNINLQQGSLDVFEKYFYELMNDAICGKVMENVEEMTDVKLAKHWERLGKIKGANCYFSKFTFADFTILDKDCLAVETCREKIFYNQPIYVKFTILEMCKWLMYQFFYGCLKLKYETNVSLCYMDFDSFIVKVDTNDDYKDIMENLGKFDTSNFDEDNISLGTTEAIGRFKDLNGGLIQTKYVGLRSKLYHIETINRLPEMDEEKQVNIDDYISRLDIQSLRNNYINSSDKKVCLSLGDYKRCINANGITTTAWGHHALVGKGARDSLDLQKSEIYFRQTK